MSKKKPVTEADMANMGLFESSPGIFSKVDPKHQTRGFEVKKELPDVDLGFEPWSRFDPRRIMLTKEGLQAKANATGSSWAGSVMNPEMEFYKSPQELMEDYRKSGIVNTLRRTEPFPIPEIRELTGKKRKEAVEMLHNASKELIRDLGPTDIYIPTNVASSKNSKQLFKTGKKNAQVTRDAAGNTSTVIKETSFITDSQVSKAYRKETEASWRINRLKFLSALEGLKKPYSIELTFIRATLGRMDFHNMSQLPFDLMVDNGWVFDDESTEVHPVFNKVVYYSKHFAGLVIRVIR